MYLTESNIKVYLSKVYAPNYGPLFPSEKFIVTLNDKVIANFGTYAEIKFEYNVKIGAIVTDDKGKKYRKVYAR